MSGKNGSIRLIFALAIFTMVCAVGVANAANKVKGTLYSINAPANSVTLKSNGILTTINIAANTKLIRNKAAANLSGLVLGDKITAVYKNSLYPSKVKASGKRVSQLAGKVTGVSPSGVVQMGGASFKATAHTRIVRNGKASSLDSLAMDDDIIAHVEDSSGDADDIQGEGPEEGEAKGPITSVDTIANTVTFQDALGNSITVNVTADTMIELGDAVATIADLSAGMIVEVHYDPTTFNAFRIEAEMENEDTEIEGTITAVDLAASTVTIQDGLGTSVTVVADAGTMIERDGEPAFLSDLQVGDAGKAEYDVHSFVANEIDANSGGPDDSSL